MADALFDAVYAGEAQRVVELLKPMDEAERREHGPRFATLAREIIGYPAKELLATGELREVGPDHSDWDRLHAQDVAAQVAALGVATLTELKRIGQWMLRWTEPHALEVLLDRRPSWLPQFAEWALAGDQPRMTLIRDLIAAGAIERPDAKLYFDALLWDGTSAEEIALDEIWEMLAHHGEQTLKSADDNRGAGWAQAVLARVSDGRMDRDRVLDLTLDMLASDLNAHRSAWYTALWRDLEPAGDERNARHDQLTTLLGAAAKPIVSFAVDELLKTERPVPAGQLTPALTAKAKKTAKGALKLLDREPDAEIAAIALGHEAADVQQDALDRLEAWGGARDALLEHLDLLAATQRPRAEALLGLSLEREAASEPVAVDHIPEQIRAALNFGGPLPPAPIPGEPVLGERIEPYTTLDELAAALAEALPEGRGWSDERLLDAILRRCDDKRPFDGPLKPFVKRLNKLDEHYPSIATVARAWLTGEAPEPTIADMTNWRIVAAAKRAAKGQAGPLLALPTHTGGWIDPAVFSERAKATRRHDEWDLAEALLRLAPDGREQALKAVKIPRNGPVAESARAVRDPSSIQARVVIRDADPVHDRLWVEYDKPQKLSRGPLWLYVWDSSSWPGETDPFIWPERRDIACANAIVRLGWALETQTDDSVSDTLEALLDPYQPLAPTTLRFALLALSSGAEREHLVATDLVIAAIEDGRVDAPALIPHLRTDVELVITARLGKRLATIAQTGPLHRAVVRETLAAISLEHLPARRRTPLRRLLEELRAASSKDESELLLAARVRRAERWLTR